MRKKQVEFAVVSSTGRIRRNNEDNFYCGGHIREDVNDNADVMYCGRTAADANELFAVFDGMGGEACGEVASYVAAERALQFTRAKDAYTEYLQELTMQINEKICQETEERSLVIMGTTAAMLQVSSDHIYVLNSGDSRIYQLTRHELRQISQDHVVATGGGKAITQFLGMPVGYVPRPFIARGKYKSGDLFLLCSDGVTDMLTDGEICRIIDDGKMELDVLARALVDAALDKGGVDNTTALLVRFS